MTEQIGFITKIMLEIINKLTPPYDKTGHYFTGEYPASLSFALYLILEHYYNLNAVLTAIVLLTLSVLVALWKEYYYDPKNGGQTEKLDAFFTILPALKNLILILILKTIIFN